MKFVVKYFPEITIKSRPVRKRLVGQLGDNLRSVLREVDPESEHARRMRADLVHGLGLVAGQPV